MSTDPFGVAKAYELHEHSRKQNAAVGAGVGAVYGGGASYLLKGPINRGAKNMAEKGARAKWAGGPKYAKVSHLARNASTPGEAAAAEHAMKKIRAGMSGKQRAGLKAAKYISNPRANKVGIITGIVGGTTATVSGSYAARKPKAKTVSKAFNPIKTGKNLHKYGKFAHKVLRAPTDQVPVRDKATLLGMAGKKMAKEDPVGAGLAVAGATTTGVGGTYEGHRAKQHLITKSKNITYHETAGVRSRRTVRAGSTAAAALGAAALATPGGRRFASNIGHVATKAPEDFKVARTASGFRRDLGLPGMSRMDATKQTAHLAGRGVKRAASQDPIPAALATGAGITGGAAGIAATKSRYHGRQEQKLRRKRKAGDVDKSAFGVDIAKADTATKKKKPPGPSTGRTATGALFPGVHGLVAGKKGHKLRAAGNEFGSGLVGGIGGNVAGNLAGTAVAAASKGKIHPGNAALTGQAIVGRAGGIGGAVYGTHRAQAKGHYKPDPGRIAKSAFGVEHVSKAKSETGLLGNASGEGNSLLHSGRGSDSKLLHDGKGSGKALLHSGKGTLIKTGLGHATIDTKLGAK